MAGSEYYDHTTYPATSATGSSADMRAELDSIESGFGKLIALSGNGNKYMKVNAGATAHAAALISDDGTDITAAGDLHFSNANPEILGSDPDGITYIGPSTSTSLGAVLALHGNTETNAKDINFLVTGSSELHYDDSASTWDFKLNNITTSGNINGGTLSGSNTGDQTITLTGDVTGSGTGSFATTIAAGAVDYAMIQNVSATDKILGRSTAGAGVVEEIACTSAGRALLDDADNTAQRTTLGLGTAATKATDLADLNEATIEDAIDTLANLTSIQGVTVTLADAGAADAFFGWDDTASAYENLTADEAQAIMDTATTPYGKLASDNTWGGAQRATITAVTVDTGNFDCDMAESNDFSFTLASGGSETLQNPSNIASAVGQSGSIFITQHASSVGTLAFGSQWHFEGGTAPSVTATTSAVDRIDYHVRTTSSIHAVMANDVKTTS